LGIVSPDKQPGPPIRKLTKQFTVTKSPMRTLRTLSNASH